MITVDSIVHDVVVSSMRFSSFHDPSILVIFSVLLLSHDCVISSHDNMIASSSIIFHDCNKSIVLFHDDI